MLEAKRKVVKMADAQTPDADGQDKAKPETFSREYVEELRRENAKYRTSAKDLAKQVEDRDTRLKEHDDAGKSEVERLTAEKAALEQTLKDRDAAMANEVIRSAVERAAVKMGVIDPEAAYLLIDQSDIELDGGKVGGVDKALKALLKDRPYLVKSDAEPPPPDPGSGGTPIDGDKQTANKQMLSAMTGGRK